MGLPRVGSPECFFQRPRASAAMQQELSAATRPCAQAALEHFWARRNRACPAVSVANGLPSLLVGHASNLRPASASSVGTFPVLLGRSRAPKAPALSVVRR